MPNRPWWDDPFAGFDLETTGTCIRTDRIVTSNLTLFTPTPKPPWGLEHTNMVFNPGIPIPVGAQAIHGITTEYVVANGVPTADHLPVLVGHIADLLNAGTPIVGMNIVYDLSLMYWECQRHGVPWLDQLDVQVCGPIVDIMLIDRHYDRYRRGKRKLTDLCAHYGVNHGGAHDAQQDVVATGRILYRMLSRYPELRQLDIRQLHNVQNDWRAEWTGFLQSMKRKTDPSVVVDSCWPVCTDPTHPNG